MEFIELKTLLSDMTFEQFQQVLCTLAVFYIGIAVIGYFVCSLIHVIFDLIHLCFRKDKYNNADFFTVKVYKYISRLRKQVQSAPTYTAYMVYYNRLVGALGLMVDLRIISPKVSAKILDVKLKGDIK